MTRKQTSDRVSKIAARVLHKWEGRKASGSAIRKATCWSCDLAKPSEVVALAASCLAQDETKGKRRIRPVQGSAKPTEFATKKKKG